MRKSNDKPGPSKERPGPSRDKPKTMIPEDFEDSFWTSMSLWTPQNISDLKIKVRFSKQSDYKGTITVGYLNGGAVSEFLHISTDNYL